MSELAQEILEDAGLTEADVDDVPTFGPSSLGPPPVVTLTSDINWPLISKGESFFDRALANGHIEGNGDIPYVNGIDGAASSMALDDWAKDEEARDEIDPEEGWELDGGAQDTQQDRQDEVEVTEEPELGAGASPGVKETEFWLRNSAFPGDHVAAGSFETAMQVVDNGLITCFIVNKNFLAIETTTWRG